MMPRLDGWQVAAELRREPTTRQVALIFLTSPTPPGALTLTSLTRLGCASALDRHRS
jgi:CheY-like chemotaxis protein